MPARGRQETALPREVDEIGYPPQAHGPRSRKHAVLDPIEHLLDLPAA
jgi:hypothetical protein